MGSRQVRVFAARHRGAEGADAHHVAVAPRLALLQEQAARLGGAIPRAVGKVKQAADKNLDLEN